MFTKHLHLYSVVPSLAVRWSGPNQTGHQGKQGPVIGGRRTCIDNMKRVMAAMLFTISTNAFAMNQEGHDDWMTDLPQAIALLAAIPEARPLPSRDCPVTPEMLANNPYEQIPLRRHRCPREHLPVRLQAYPASTR